MRKPARNPRPNARGPRPERWKTGPDEQLHVQYRAWLQQRNQARWRGETWHLTWEQWLDLWGDRFHLRGRRSADLCLTRIRYDQPWQVGNCDIITRHDHNQRQIDNGRKRRRTRAEIERDRLAGRP